MVASSLSCGSCTQWVTLSHWGLCCWHWEFSSSSGTSCKEDMLRGLRKVFYIPIKRQKRMNRIITEAEMEGGKNRFVISDL